MDVPPMCSPDWLDIGTASISMKVSHAMEIGVLKSHHYNIYSKASYSD